MHKLFLDWAEVTRKLGKTPSMLDYEMHGKYTTKALVRNYGGGTHVPAGLPGYAREGKLEKDWEGGGGIAGLLGYAREAKLENDWQDVLEIAEAALRVAPPPARTLVKRNLSPGRRVTANQPVYGRPMMLAGPLVYAPTNEAGVMVLFGAVAREQGFAITRVQQAFPDCEAMREIEPEKWQSPVPAPPLQTGP